MFDNFLVNVSLLRKVHYDAKVLPLVHKCFFVANNVFMVYAGQNSNFVECILALFLTQAVEGYLFKSVSYLVRPAHNFVDLRI
jgi:hypothetical protein